MDVRMPEKDKWHRIEAAEMRGSRRRYNDRLATAGGGEDDDEDRKRILSAGGASRGRFFEPTNLLMYLVYFKIP